MKKLILLMLVLPMSFANHLAGNESVFEADDGLGGKVILTGDALEKAYFQAINDVELISFSGRYLNADQTVTFTDIKFLYVGEYRQIINQIGGNYSDPVSICKIIGFENYYHKTIMPFSGSDEIHLYVYEGKISPRRSSERKIFSVIDSITCS